MTRMEPGRQNQAHHHTHEQHVDATTSKGTGGRRDEMSVWGLRGRIHTECCYCEDESGSVITFLDFAKDGGLILSLLGHIPVPTLPQELVQATHASVAHVDGSASGDSFTLFLFDFSGALIASSPVIPFGVGTIAITCFKWDFVHTFGMCDAWSLWGITTSSSATNVKVRVLLEFVAEEAA